MKSTLIDFFKRSRMAATILGLAFVALIGWVDTRLDRELSFLIIYLVPVLLTGWHAGRWQAHLVSAASGCAWWVNEHIDAFSYHHRAIPDALCRDLPPGLVRSIELEGGHRVGRGFDTIVRTILSELK